MDPSDVHPDLFGEALSHSGQRLAQLGSLLTSWVMVEARRAERRSAAQAAHSEQELNALCEQERAAWQLARTGWAPAQDQQWLATADMMQTARVWSAAAAYADTDPDAAAAVARSEERLRGLHPYAMARYDRLRAEGAGLFDAMQDALPLFARAPHARPGSPARERSVLAGGASPGGPRAQAGDEQPRVPEHPPGPGTGFSTDGGTGQPEARDAVRLAAECFPLPVRDAVHAATSLQGSRARVRTVVSGANRRPGRAL